MPALQVRELPEELYEKLKECAEREHRSIAQQTIVAVEEMLRAREALDMAGEGNGAGDAADAARMAPGGLRNVAFVQPDPAYLDLSTPAEREARIAKRKAVFAEIERLNASPTTPPPSEEQIVQWVREDRDTDHGRDRMAPLSKEGMRR